MENRHRQNEILLCNVIAYLESIWNNMNIEDIFNQFKKLGFTDEDIKYFEIDKDYEDMYIELE